MRAQLGVTSLDDVLHLCKSEPFGVYVYFTGGVDALRLADRGSIANGAFRWQRAAERPGDDWITGQKFREVVRQKPTPAASVETHDSELINWAERGQDFATVVRIARQHGDTVLVGFEGGAGALRRAERAYLQSREWKYDWADHPRGKKDLSNWIAGVAFLALLAESGAIADDS